MSKTTHDQVVETRIECLGKLWFESQETQGSASRPAHYTGGNVEPWDLWPGLDPFMALIIKHAARAGKKEGVPYEQDVCKIITYAFKALMVRKPTEQE